MTNIAFQKDPKKIIVVLDYDTREQALSLVENLNPQMCRLKVGKGMFTHYGPQFIEELMNKGFDIFLDLKFHDIPNTVAMAVKAAADLGVWMVNVHAFGGSKMLAAAREALANYQHKPLLIAVTVLTSLTDKDLHTLGIQQSLADCVVNLATIAKQAGLDGVVCSAQEAKMLRAHCGPEFCLVTPGIRLAGGAADDQQRIMTPEAAVANGANYLVIGRAITQAANPLAMLEEIQQSLA